MTMLPLRGCKCLVEIFDEDENDISDAAISTLRALGATISRKIDEDLTYFICANVSIRRLLAAKLLNIKVVSRQWVNRCQELNDRVDDPTYELTSDLVELIASIDGNCSDVVPVMNDSAAALATALRSLNSPYFSSSLPDNSYESQHPKENNSSVPMVKIATPSFKPYEPPVIESDKLKRRRSERLIDKMSDESDEDEDSEEEEDNPDDNVSFDQELKVRYTSRPHAASNTLRSFTENLNVETESDAERRRIRSAAHSGNSGRRSGGVSRLTSTANILYLANDNDNDQAGEEDVYDDNNYDDDRDNDDDEEYRTRGSRKRVVRPPPPAKRPGRSSTPVTARGKVGPPRSTSTSPTVVRASRSGGGRVKASQGRSKATTGRVSINKSLSAAAAATDSADPFDSNSSGSNSGGGNSKMVVAVTGFDPTDGERGTMLRTLLSIQSKCPVVTFPLPSDHQSDEEQTKDVVVEVLQDNEDDPHVSPVIVSHLVISNRCDNKRTMRVLFALATNALIVSEEWVYDCLCADRWVPVEQRHLVPRYNPAAQPPAVAAVDNDGNNEGQQQPAEPQQATTAVPPPFIQHKPGILTGRSYCILQSSRPDMQALTRLIRAAGGKVLNDSVALATNAANLISGFIVGDGINDLTAWINLMRRKKQSKELRAVMAVGELLAAGIPLLTAKFIANCLEERQIRYALRKEGEALTAAEYNEINEKVRMEIKMLFPRSPGPSQQSSVSPTRATTAATAVQAPAAAATKKKAVAPSTAAAAATTGDSSSRSSRTTRNIDTTATTITAAKPSHKRSKAVKAEEPVSLSSGGSSPGRYTMRGPSGKFLKKSQYPPAPATAVDTTPLVAVEVEADDSRMMVDDDNDQQQHAETGHDEEAHHGTGTDVGSDNSDGEEDDLNKRHHKKPGQLQQENDSSGVHTAIATPATSSTHRSSSSKPPQTAPQTANSTTGVGGGSVLGMILNSFWSATKQQSSTAAVAGTQANNNIDEDEVEDVGYAGPATQNAASSLLLLSSGGSKLKPQFKPEPQQARPVIAKRLIMEEESYDDLVASPSQAQQQPLQLHDGDRDGGRRGSGRLKRKFSSR